MRTTKPDKYSRTLRRAYQDFKAGDLSLATLSMIIRAVWRLRGAA